MDCIPIRRSVSRLNGVFAALEDLVDVGLDSFCLKRALDFDTRKDFSVLQHLDISAAEVTTIFAL